ncbi:MAG: tetratricopeptide repeat protein [Saprospiraceae bacterium]|jgi:tetratricopeptide (TPR) repeat protein|nr:tetratricopeptide repeat protein [Saprospiraceae bacterium]
MQNKFWTLLIVALFTIFSFSCGGEQAKEEEKRPIKPTMNINPVIDGLNVKIVQNPQDAGLYYQRANVYYENDGYDEAIQDLQIAIGIDSLQADYYHLLADVYLDYFNSRLALKTMEMAADLFPERIPTLLKYSEFQHILRKHDESMKTIDQVLKLDPQNAEAYFMFGVNFSELGDTSRAINSFQEAVSINPELVDAWIKLGQLYNQMNNPLASKFFDNAIRVSPNNIEALHAKAGYQSNEGDLNAAVETFRKITEIAPQYEDAYFNMGLLYLDLDSIQKGYDHLNIAIKTSPTFIRAYYFRGVAAEMLGDKEGAKKDYEQALRMAPDYERAQQALQNLQSVQ